MQRAPDESAWHSVRNEVEKLGCWLEGSLRTETWNILSIPHDVIKKLSHTRKAPRNKFMSLFMWELSILLCWRISTVTEPFFQPTRLDSFPRWWINWLQAPLQAATRSSNLPQPKKMQLGFSCCLVTTESKKAFNSKQSERFGVISLNFLDRTKPRGYVRAFALFFCLSRSLLLCFLFDPLLNEHSKSISVNFSCLNASLREVFELLI